MPDKILIGVPVLNRLDLLERALATYDVPHELIVVNNSRDPAFAAELGKLVDRHGGVSLVHNAGRNLGVAASWNLLLNMARKASQPYLYVGSNDTLLQPGQLQKVVDFDKRPHEVLWLAQYFNFFVMSTELPDKVGWVDENFYPAYCEDNDLCRRCHLAAMPVVDMTNPAEAGERAVPLYIEHLGSQTIKSDPQYLQRNHRTFDRNKAYYARKWGGEPRHETFTHPFNCTAHDWRYWAPPADTAALDWDNR